MTKTKQVRAFSPANISCLFTIYKHENPRWAGSYGMGFTLNEGVTVTVSLADKSAIFFNKKKVTFPAVAYVLRKLTKKKVVIDIQSSLPVGSGFGLSGASALATAYALNKLLHLKKTKKQLAVIAHTADVVAKTGLGGVVNQYFGGFLVKLVPSSHFKVVKLPFANKPVYCRAFSKISTKLVLKNQGAHKTINAAGAGALDFLSKKLKANEMITLGEAISLSKDFAEKSHLLVHAKTRETIRYVEKHGGHASMNMLGNAVYSDTQFPGSMKFFISDTPAHLS